MDVGSQHNHKETEMRNYALIVLAVALMALTAGCKKSGSDTPPLPPHWTLKITNNSFEATLVKVEINVYTGVYDEWTGDIDWTGSQWEWSENMITSPLGPQESTYSTYLGDKSEANLVLVYLRYVHIQPSSELGYAYTYPGQIVSGLTAWKALVGATGWYIDGPA